MRAIGSLVVVLLLSHVTHAQSNWPEFRGPHGNGYVAEADLPLEIDADSHVQSALCVDLASGEILRDLVIFENEKPEFCHPMNSYATPTPAIEDGRVYLHFGTYGTVCLDTATGERLWERRDLNCDHFRGPASSPILYDGKLIVALDGFDYQFVVATTRNRARRYGKRIATLNTAPTAATSRRRTGPPW